MRNQKGFTLIELVVVIVVLGILAAVAVPKFIDIQEDARISAVKGMQGALQGAASLGRAQALVDGASNGGTVTIENESITLVEGYPASADLEDIINFEGFDYIAETDAARFNLGGRVDCFVRYTDSNSGAFPVISIVTSGCE